MKKIFFYLLIFSQIYFGQTQITTKQLSADYSREVIFDFSSGAFVTTHELFERAIVPSVFIQTYKNFSGNRWLAVYQWMLPDNIIPDGSVINKVTIMFDYISNFDGNTYVPIDFAKSNKDITFENLSYDNLSSEFTFFLDATLITNHEPYQINSDDLNESERDELFQAIQEALPNDKLIISIYCAGGTDGEGLQIDYPRLTITYTPPQQNVTVRQKHSDGIEFGEIGHWENNNWVKYPSSHTFTFGINNTEYFFADTNADYGDKFNRWNQSKSYNNFSGFIIDENLSVLTANFEEVDEAYLKFSVENTTTQYGYVKFKDPWFRDSSDAKGICNRGLNPIWHSYSSPYQITTGGEHQGVFLGQGYSDPNKPYYSVKVESPQTISINN